MARMHDVIVVGAGPSGLNSARRLAEKGLNVAVLEKKNEVGKDIVCTGIVGKETFEKFGLPSDSILCEVQNVKMISPYGTSIIYEHPVSFAYVVDREKFDKNLADISQSEGASLELGNHVLDVCIGKNYVEVLTEVRSEYIRKIRAKMLILATGIDSRFNKKLGLGYSKEFLNGAQVELEMKRIHHPAILVGKDIAPGAFAWMVPVNGKKVRIGLITKKDPKTYFKNLVKKLYPEEAEGIKKEQIQFKAIAQGLLTKTYGDRVLVVGEAAGQVKTTTGGGIFFGLLCSEIVSEVIFKRFCEDSFASRELSEYERLWKKAIQKEILVGYYTRKICGRLSNFQIENMFQLAKSDGILPLIRERGNFDWHSELILALAKKAPIRSIQSVCSFSLDKWN